MLRVKRVGNEMASYTARISKIQISSPGSKDTFVNLRKNSAPKNPFSVLFTLECIL
jgi:hypothetical protein